MSTIAALLLKTISNAVGDTFNVERVDGNYQKWSFLETDRPITETQTIALKRTSPSSYSNSAIRRDKLVMRVPGTDADNIPYVKAFRAETSFEVPGWMTQTQSIDAIERHLDALRHTLIEGQMRDNDPMHG